MPALVIANILGAVGGALSIVSTDIRVFAVFRFITGMAFDNCFTMMYILGKIHQNEPAFKFLYQIIVKILVKFFV